VSREAAVGGVTLNEVKGAMPGYAPFAALRVTLLPIWILVLILCSAPRFATAQGLEDTLLTDTLDVDTVDITARYLKALEQEEVRVPVLQALAPPGPRPALTRLVFTRDSMEWLSGATVGDVLAQVPGVYVWRGG
jgi:hypothetical protein